MITEKELFLYLVKKYSSLFPNLDFSESSILSKVILYPIAVILKDIFALTNDLSLLLQDEKFRNNLLANFYGIENKVIMPIPGKIKLNVLSQSDIKIPYGLKIFSLSDESSYGYVIEEFYLTKEEIENRNISNSDITINFAGNLKLNDIVAFDGYYEGNIIKAEVIQEFREKIIENNEKLNEILLKGRKIVLDTFSNDGIMAKLSTLYEDVEIVDSIANNDNPFVIFDINNSMEYKYLKFCYFDENNNLQILDEPIIEIGKNNNFIFEITANE